VSDLTGDEPAPRLRLALRLEAARPDDRVAPAAEPVADVVAPSGRGLPRRAQPGTEGKIFATALGGGILLDATLIRGVLVPAVVAILGRWNWWLPGWAARPLRVESSPVKPVVIPDPTSQAV